MHFYSNGLKHSVMGSSIEVLNNWQVGQDYYKSKIIHYELERIQSM